MMNASHSPAPGANRPAASTRIGVLCIASCVLGVGLAGCQSWSVPTAPGWMKNPLAKTEPVPAPHRMAVIWSEDLMQTPGAAPTRGFGGRVYLYDAQDKPMKADGQLVVFAFNDSRMQPGKERIPDRKFVFPADKLAEHFSESQIGPSYSVWLPWDQVPAAQTEISLLPIFMPKDGTAVVGSQNSNLLIARNIDGSASVENRIEVTRSTGPESNLRSSQRGRSRSGAGGASEAAQVSYDGATPQPSRMRTLTIPMTQDMAQRMNIGPPAAQSMPNMSNYAPGQSPTTNSPTTWPQMPTNGAGESATGTAAPQTTTGGGFGAGPNGAPSAGMTPAASMTPTTGMPPPTVGTSATPMNGMGASFGAVNPYRPTPLNTLPVARATGSLRVVGSATTWDPFANPLLPASRSGLPRSPAPASPSVQ